MSNIVANEWSRVESTPTHPMACEFIDLWSGARFVREVNPLFQRGYKTSRGEWRFGYEPGWVWRGPPHMPQVVWHDGSEE